MKLEYRIGFTTIYFPLQMKKEEFKPQNIMNSYVKNSSFLKIRLLYIL